MADPVDVAVSSAVSVFLLTGISGLNPIGGLNVCLLWCVLLRRGLYDGPIPSLEDSYRLFEFVSL
jgi:hypothetical protein